MIVVSEFIDDAGLQRLQRGQHAIEYRADLWKDREALRAGLQRASALIVRNQTRVDADLLASAPHLRVVGRLGVGLDNIDQQLLAGRGIQLFYARGINAVAVAEYVLAALLHLSRRLDSAWEHVRSGGFERSRFGGFELAGQTLGLLGLGETGLRVAHRARALGMRVIAHDPARVPWESAVEDGGVGLGSLEELIAASRFLSLHLPGQSGPPLLDAARLALLPRGSYLVNTARGDLIDQTALEAALRSGQLAGAVLDVTSPEPLPGDHPLRSCPNLWITPHVAGLSKESQERVSLRVAEGVLALLERCDAA
jgi:phosphoglycerate dehydrogenase-like enzyme